jgi:hypothetical protein
MAKLEPLASCVGAHQTKPEVNNEGLMGTVKDSAVKMKANKEKMVATDLEANPE